jgi:hypothetical protein
MDNYVTQHTISGHECAFKGFGVNEIASVIKRNGALLVRLSKNGSGVISIDIVEYNFGLPFIAISHVWSGGLGNPVENSLPVCQLKFLYEAIDRCLQKADVENYHNYYPDSYMSLGEDELGWILKGTFDESSLRYLWIDTLCIPMDHGDKELSSLKRKTIDKMAFVYAAAMHVLVLDQTVEQLSFEDTPDVTITAQLLTCPWMSRCWTFQEACLTRRFSFLLKDIVINPRRWRTSIYNVPSYSVLGYI